MSNNVKFYIPLKSDKLKFPIINKNPEKYIKDVFKVSNMSDVKKCIIDYYHPFILTEDKKIQITPDDILKPDYYQELSEQIVIVKDNDKEDPLLNYLKLTVLYSKQCDVSKDKDTLHSTIISLLEILNKIKPLISQFKIGDKINYNTFIKALLQKKQIIEDEKLLEEDFESFYSSLQDSNILLYKNNKELKRLNLSNYNSDLRSGIQTFLNDNLSNGSLTSESEKIKIWNSLENNFEEIEPFPHQQFISDYLNENTPYQGLLLYHGLGSGKSGGSILISEGYRNKKTVIMLPASLRANYKNEILKFGETAYKKNYHWIFYKIDDSNLSLKDKYKDVLANKGINKELYDKIVLKKTDELGNTVNGIWMIDYSKDTPNYDELSMADKKSLENQINITLNHKYSFCHYNAGKYTITLLLKNLIIEYPQIYSELFNDKPVSQLSNKDIDTMLNYIYINNINPLDNKVIIVDEIHNLTSSINSGSYNSVRLYELILRSKNSIKIFLSGTPVINFPYELGIMFNMLRGLMVSFTIGVNKITGIFNKKELEQILSKFNLIERFSVNEKSKDIQVSRTPFNFVKNYNQQDEYIGLIKDKRGMVNEEQFLSELKKYLQVNGYEKNSSIIQKDERTIFKNILREVNDLGVKAGDKQIIENSENVFNNMYVDQDTLKVKNETDFKNKILGLVSFYNEVSAKEGEDNLFPDKIIAPSSKTDVYMTDYQFIQYIQARIFERKLEDAASKSKRVKDYSTSNVNVNDKVPNLFKVYTRQRGIFVFPPQINRPMASVHRLKEKITKIALAHQESSTDFNEVKLNYLKSLEDIKNFIMSEFYNNLDNKSQYITKIKQFIENIDKIIDISPVLSVYQITNLKLFLKVYNFLFSKEYYTILDLYEDHQSDSFILTQNNPNEFILNEHINLVSDYLSFDDFGANMSYEEECKQAISTLNKNNLTVNDSLFNLSVLSPKYVKILENINNSPGSAIIYSQYRQVEGIEIFTKVLDYDGYYKFGDANTEINVGDKVKFTRKNIEGKTISTIHSVVLKNSDGSFKCSDIEDNLDEKQLSLCKYALWTGTETVEEREKILSSFNSVENMYGDVCLILLITKSGAEGISLKYVRQVHIMEPYWNNVRINQVIGRARRIKSHIELPLEERNVEIFNYIIKYTNEQISGDAMRNVSSEILSLVKDNLIKDEEDKSETLSKDTQLLSSREDDEQNSMAKSSLMSFSDFTRSLDGSLTSDEVLKNISDKKEVLLNVFLDYLKEVSIDCEFNRNDNLRSDSSLEDRIQCVKFLNDNNDFLFDFNQKGNIETKDISSATVKKQFKKVIIPITVNKDGTKTNLRFLIFIPIQYSSWKQVDSGHKMYDFYIYHGLNPDKKVPLQSQIEAGVINISDDGKFSMVLNQNFKKNIDNYLKIEKCINIVDSVSEIKFLDLETEVQKNSYNTSVFREYNKLNIEMSNTWMCVGCNTRYPKGQVCDTCGLDEND